MSGIRTSTGLYWCDRSILCRQKTAKESEKGASSREFALLATIVDGKKRIPFMRGMLVHYLIERDFSHEEASSVANSMRDSLAKEKEIARKDFLKILTKQIRKDYGERSVGDLVFWEPAPAGFTVETEDGSRPFSREILSHSIQATGLAPDSAYQIARAIASR